MIKNVLMNTADISSNESPIIGTTSLATCLGILLYEENQKVAIVGHCTSNWIPIVLKMLDLIDDSKPCIFKYLIIPGYYHDKYNTKNKIVKFFSNFSNEKIKFVPYEINYEENIIFDSKTKSYEFWFDANNGVFVTKKICYNLRGDTYGNNTHK